ncbi:MAG: M56 family metallopeptidase [Weeksellaceae bacterium]
MSAFLIQSIVILSLFYTAYYFFLERITCFKQNRYFLLTGLVASLVLPVLPLNFAGERTEYIRLNRSVMESVSLPQEPVEQIVSGVNNWGLAEIIPLVYILGVVFFSLLMIYQTIKISAIIRNGISIKRNGRKLIHTKKEVSPFSFFNHIVLNPDMLTEQQLEHVLTHENAHIIQWHQLDILLAEFLKIVLWFFPLSWLYGKAIRTNLEFLADEYSLNNKNINKIEYQLNLLVVSQQPQTVGQVNNFSKKLIKNRILMLNRIRTQKQIARISILLIPLLLLISCGVAVKTQSRNEKVKRVIIFEDDNSNQEVVKIKNFDEKTTSDSLVGDDIVYILPDTDDGNYSKNGDTLFLPKTRFKVDMSKFDKLNFPDALSVNSDAIIIKTDSITNDQLMILKNKFKSNGDTIFLSKNGVFGHQNNLKKLFEENQSQYDELFKQSQEMLEKSKNFKMPEMSEKEIQKLFKQGQEFKEKYKDFKAPELSEDIRKQGQEMLEKAKNFKIPEIQRPNIPLHNLPNLKDPNSSGDYSDYPKLLDNWKGSIYPNNIIESNPNNQTKNSRTKIIMQNSKNLYENFNMMKLDNKTSVIPPISFQNGRNPKIFIDGRESDLKKLKEIEANGSHKIVFMTSNDPSNIEKYGKTVKKGVIIAVKE